MTTTREPTTPAGSPVTDRQRPWIRLLGWAAVLSAAADVALMALVGAVIPPVAAGVALSFVGIALLARRPRAGTALLAAVSTLLVVSGAPFALPHLAHPESAIDFGHAVVHLGGRLVAVAAAVGAWRSAPALLARRLTRVAVGALLATVVTTGVAAGGSTGETASLGDVTVPVQKFAFPPEVKAASGATVFVDNRDLTRHTFTVRGTSVSEQLRPGVGARFRLDLAPGAYPLFCDVPGHEAMRATLIVE
ncbi:MAG: cupredoxin domain-containing protein [Actinomycetota bacterium]|nr:cupredoxin domain-containing protein [Actinomycetota bacterium]